jgi:hypothetical protein
MAKGRDREFGTELFSKNIKGKTLLENPVLIVT